MRDRLPLPKVIIPAEGLGIGVLTGFVGIGRWLCYCARARTPHEYFGYSATISTSLLVAVPYRQAFGYFILCFAVLMLLAQFSF